jgi:hypothetical protein
MDDDAQLLHEQCGTSTLAQEARQSHVWDMTVKHNALPMGLRKAGECHWVGWGATEWRGSGTGGGREFSGVED